MGDPSKSIAPLLGRILLCWIFIYSSIGQVLAFSANAQHAAEAGIPFPSLAIVASIIIQFCGGVALLLGFQARVVGWLLFLFLIPTTVFLHKFWVLQGAARNGPEIHFLKNMGIMGGLLFVGTFGAGAFSVDSALAGKRLSPSTAGAPTRSAT